MHCHYCCRVSKVDMQVLAATILVVVAPISYERGFRTRSMFFLHNSLTDLSENKGSELAIINMPIKVKAKSTLQIQTNQHKK